MATLAALLPPHGTRRMAGVCGRKLLHTGRGPAADRARAGLGAAAGGELEHWPVVIVGAGPTGLTLSALLSRMGVASLLLERAPSLTEHPQVPLPVLLS